MAVQGDHHSPDEWLAEARARVAEGLAAIADGDVADGDVVFNELLARQDNGGPEATSQRRAQFVSRDLLLEAFRCAPSLDGDRVRDDLDAVAGQDFDARPSAPPL